MLLKINRNPNAEIFEEVSQAVIKNQGYCPCKLEHIPETKCPCKEFMQSTSLCECHCGRYIKEEF